jgi:hypothetical protein
MRNLRTAAENSIESPTDLKYVSAGNDMDERRAPTKSWSNTSRGAG